jgi:hypothetical protein
MGDQYPDLNPRWVAFCVSRNADPRGHHGASFNADFMAWIGRQHRAFCAARGVSADAPMGPTEHAAFTAHLEAC